VNIFSCSSFFGQKYSGFIRTRTLNTKATVCGVYFNSFAPIKIISLILIPDLKLSTSFHATFEKRKAQCVMLISAAAR